MKTTGQLAAELYKKLQQSFSKAEDMKHIKAAIEQAREPLILQLQAVIAFLESCKGDEWDRRQLLSSLRLTAPSAAQASEQRCETAPPD